MLETEVLRVATEEHFKAPHWILLGWQGLSEKEQQGVLRNVLARAHCCHRVRVEYFVAFKAGTPAGLYYYPHFIDKELGPREVCGHTRSQQGLEFRTPKP